MNKNETLKSISPYVESLYGAIALRQAIHAGRVTSIEAFILAVEGILDYLMDENRDDRYRNFRVEGQFGEELFHTMFERKHSCRLMLVAIDDETDMTDANALQDQYTREFESYWDNFLKWRESNISQKLNGND